MIGDTLQTLEVRAADKHLELVCRIPPEIPDFLIGDPGRLRQIIVNLVGNAIKFTESGEIEVSIANRELSEQRARSISLFAIRGLAYRKTNRSESSRPSVRRTAAPRGSSAEPDWD